MSIKRAIEEALKPLQSYEGMELIRQGKDGVWTFNIENLRAVVADAARVQNMRRLIAHLVDEVTRLKAEVSWDNELNQRSYDASHNTFIPLYPSRDRPDHHFRVFKHPTR